MGVKGLAIGGALGALLGGPLGALFGAALGDFIEKGMEPKEPARGRGARRSPSAASDSLVFCASAAAMLAKVAKADGVVSRKEIASVEAAFARLGFSSQARAYAIDVFRRAKDDVHTIDDYAREFARAVPSIEVREFLYELLWDIACSDGAVSSNELEMLRRVTASLSIPAYWFNTMASERLGTSGAGERRDGGGASSGESLAEAYALLGVSPDASDDEVKSAYRAKAKKYHPDALRAQGLPDEMVSKATDMMAKVNAAWSVIEKARRL